MVKGTQAQQSGNRDLETAIMKLQGLSHESKTLVILLIDRLAEAEGVSIKTEFRPPLENMGHWLTKLRSERKADSPVTHSLRRIF